MEYKALLEEAAQIGDPFMNGKAGKLADSLETCLAQAKVQREILKDALDKLQNRQIEAAGVHTLVNDLFYEIETMEFYIRMFRILQEAYKYNV